MIKEIGSEFWEIEIGENKKLPKDVSHQYLLSGRTALDFIIRDIKVTSGIKSVYLPSYCCHTMIQPFLDNEVDIEFYDVSFEDGRYKYDLDFENKSDVVLIMNYFGFQNQEVDYAIKRYKENDKLIIEDSTHSWFSKSSYNKNSDYVFASLRKWTGLPGGAIALKQCDDFVIKEYNNENHKYIELRKQSAILKKQFIENGIGKKEIFLEIFNEAEEILDNKYKEYGISRDLLDVIKSIDSEKIIEKRKENSKVLIEGLKGFEGIESIEMAEEDVPLFVPIIVLDGKRDELQDFLIKNNIYCPIHWPPYSVHKIKNRNIYDDFLSLVCDQRYKKTDMDRILNLINEFYRKEV